MSPLSIAQYLDPTNPKLQFDVVIFDEASQVKPEDALGAFMRGKTAVVMGDTQQLPPTSFFDQMTDSESGEEVATALDMESILHLCKLSFPVKMLKWHYRSRHESLINISNREFYDNELLVYPSPSHTDPELGLKFHYNPNTQYHRGEGSANPLEAKDVVKEIFNHFAKYGDKKSLGVGTFSVAQKNAILEELEIERKAHPEYEALFSENKEERFFVKNLETIQGDERDVILISVGYGYDTEGKMSLNFGPLNQDGGERRLNVLVTRAREKCVVFTNFRAHDIHLTANPPFGVKSLQAFLEYAENLHYNQSVQYEDYDEAPFEDAICNFIAENGYEVDKKVGCAGFRVDLAIKDPDNPGKYILGIQCDGHNYASSKVARDRDRLREQVLKGLGWNIYHIWSTDWYRNRDLARAKLLENIESTIVNTKVKDLKKKINDVESMKINPVTTVILGKDDDEDDNDDFIENYEEEDIDIVDNIADNDLANIQSIKEEINEKTEKDKEKEDLIIDIPAIENIKIEDKKPNVPINENKNKKINKNINKEKEKKTDIPKENIRKEEKKKNKSNTHKNQEKVKKSNSKPQRSPKFNSSKDDVSSKFEANSKEKKPDVKDNSSNKKDILDGEFKVKENVNGSNNAKNTSNRNKNNGNTVAKSLMNRLRNIGDELVNNRQNNGSQNIEESQKAQKPKKEQIKKSKESQVEKSIPKKEENRQKDKKSIEKEPLKEETVDLETNNIHDQIDETVNEFEEKESIISDDDIEYTTEENLEVDIEENIKEDNKEDTEDEISEDIKGAPVYIFEDDDEDDVIVFGLEDDMEDVIEEDIDDIEDISEDIIQELDEEDLETNESEGIENMREYKAPRRKKDEDAFDDSPDVIVPISAEIRNNKQNNSYEEDGDYITPIDADEFEEFYEESEDSVNESGDDSKSNGQSQSNEEAYHDPNNPDSPYYYSAVGIDNALKKNAVQYPRNNDRNKTGLAGTVSSIKNEMLYLKASMDEIENPTERETVYVIDRNADDEFFEDPYDPYQEPAVIDNTQNPKEDSYESLFTSKKHEYLDKIEEYTNSSSDGYVEDSADSFLDEIPEFDYIDDESEPIIPISSSINQETDVYETTKTYPTSGEPIIEDYIPEESIILEELGDELIDSDDEFVHIDDIEIDDDTFEDIITDVGQGYQDMEDERIKETNVLRAVDNTRLTPTGELSDYIEDYKEIENLIIKSPSEIYDDEKKLATAVMDIVAAEGPVHVDTVIRRLREGCGLSRAGTKFKNTILEVIDRNENHLLLIRENDFLFIDYDSVKVRKRVKPNIDLISEVEIEKAIDLVLSFEKSLKVQELAKSVSRTFGFRSTSKKTSNKITLVIDSMIGKGILINNNGKIEFR